MRRIPAFVAALVVVCLGVAWAGGVGRVTGAVLDDGGLPVPGALVTLACPQLIGGAMQRVADDQGVFTFVEIPPGDCTVAVQKQGFGEVKKVVSIAADRSTNVPIELRYGAEEVVIVSRDRENTSRSPTFSAEYLSRIPSGRSYQDVVGQSAGVIGGGNASSAGAAYNENTWDRDAYAPITENVFRAVIDSPLSTFAADVDTASFSNVRRFLTDGQKPPVDAVRIEELLNYFTYPYAAPTDGPIGAAIEVTDAPWAAGHRLVRIGLRAADVPASERPPRNLVFLVDVSGSMSGPDRLPLVVRGLSMLAEQLDRRDHVAIVVYAGAAGVVLPPTSGDAHGVILNALSRLSAGGSTAGGAGLRAAYALAKENFQAGAINRVILATDGDFNVGVSSDSEMVKIVEKERDEGVFLTVLGVGRGNLQDTKMELLADRGNGNYAYIDGFDELRKVLGEQVGQTLITVAKDVKLQVEFNPAKVSAWRLIGYENRLLADRDFRDDAKDAGEMGAGHTVTALYEIVPATTPVRSEVGPLRYQRAREPVASDELLTLRVRWKAPAGSRAEERAWPVMDEGTAFSQASADTRWAASVAGFGMLLRGSADRGALDWTWVREAAREALGADPEGYRAEFLGMIEKARRVGQEVAVGE